MKPLSHLHVAILAGGRGTRTWPLSRRRRPKQLLDLVGSGPLLAATIERIAPVCDAANLVVVAPPELTAAVRRVTGLPAGNVLVEPEPRSTAPAVALAALIASVRDPQAILLALPADHHVEDAEALREAIGAGARAARRTRGIVIFGAVPEGPSSAYGYLVPGEEVALKGAPGLVRVRRFVEKPPEARARRLLGKGALWNSGMFCLHAAAVLEEIAALLPELGDALTEIRPHVGRRSFRRVLREVWPSVPAISFDHGVLESSSNVHAVPLEAGWSDVGTLESLAALLTPDGDGNRARGQAVFHDASSSLVLQGTGSRDRAVVLAGVEGLAVIDTGDALLVCPRDGVPDLTGLLERLREERPELE